MIWDVHEWWKWWGWGYVGIELMLPLAQGRLLPLLLLKKDVDGVL
jgi:hypothetical protein